MASGQSTGLGILHSSTPPLFSCIPTDTRSSKSGLMTAFDRIPNVLRLLCQPETPYQPMFIRL
ncbi:hypothetical protein CONPUDRAFT_88811 [Coniophora puteana RWD-64-598 SS2]|uniref:Uncharacterized protein n=1 Tax=Coniophora puteana (strain RWD-64-598) TaxID=741705 RepID=A0A5M3MU66_CONPW|nr:uncharacterized protein CONPUDRAFT_88811 [Coniophora puteana RWD-64-598 SS2]EIW82708.1 hypothetical protein CONPUDRAFT_88811 [Coniophora puteana RWD-64-598 SS2]